MFKFDYQKIWVVYLVFTYTVFTIPEPVFAQGPVYIRNNTNPAEPTGGGGGGPSNDDGGGDGSITLGEGGAEPVAAASSISLGEVEAASAINLEEDNVIGEESNNRFRGGPMPPRKNAPGGGRPPRRHPPPRKMSPIGPPPRKPQMIKQGSLNKPKPVPKYHHDSREQGRHSHEHRGPPRHPPPPPRGNSIESMENGFRGRPSKEMDGGSGSREDFRHGSGSSERGSSSRENSRPPQSPPPPPPPPPQPSPPSPSQGKSMHQGNNNNNNNPAPSPSSLSYDGEGSPFTTWPKEPRPVQLAYYYDSHDGQDLHHLIKDHHLRRRKDCDGLDNFVYDLDVIAFLLGVIAAGIGLYSDVIPFFNEGVKITYNNDLMGDGVDFPHDYWPKHDAQIDAARAAGAGALNQVVVTPQLQQQQPVYNAGHKRTISLGSKEDHVREVLSVTGEFIGMIGLGISFIALMPHLVEKFFYTLDWWFGKRGLWKQYLYTYKCEIHPYPKPGWGR